MEVTGNVQVKNGKYYAVLNLREQGKRKQKWIGTGLRERGNKKNAEKILSELCEKFSDDASDKPEMTVAEYFQNWLEDIKQDVRPNTYRSYYGNMVNHIIPYFYEKGTLLCELKAVDLEDYYRFKLHSDSNIRSSEALSASTIKHHHQNMCKALSDAARRGIIDANPALMAKTPRAEKYKASFLNTDQIDELLDVFRGSTIELPVELTAVYGFRRSEVLGLKWKSVDLKKRTITISETLQQYTHGDYTERPKTESSYRTLPMTDQVYDILIRQRQHQSENKEMLGNGYKDNDYVCTFPDGEVISPNYLTVHFHDTLLAGDLPVIRFHDLRHSTASNLLSKGFSVVQVQEWLGHASPSTTLNFYSHVDATSKKAVADGIENMISLK